MAEFSKAAQLLQSRPERSGWQQNRGDRVDSSPTEWTLDLQPRRSRVITGTRYFRAYAAEPKIPHGIASRSAEALLFNYMGVFDARL